MQKRKTFRAFILQNIFGLDRLKIATAKDRLEIKTFMNIGHDFLSRRILSRKSVKGVPYW